MKELHNLAYDPLKGERGIFPLPSRRQNGPATVSSA